jgi:putative flippase GtrA
MRRIQQLFNGLINFFYPPFRGLMNEQLFRYAFCGGFATALDIAVFFISYNYILAKQNLHLGFITLSPYVAAFIIAFFFSFPVGFFLQKYITFTNSVLRGRVQLLRYSLIVAINIALNILFLKLFVEQLHFFPTVARIVTAVIVVTFSYFSQRHYSFKNTGSTPLRIQIKRIKEKVGR